MNKYKMKKINQKINILKYDNLIKKFEPLQDINKFKTVKNTHLKNYSHNLFNNNNSKISNHKLKISNLIYNKNVNSFIPPLNNTYQSKWNRKNNSLFDIFESTLNSSLNDAKISKGNRNISLYDKINKSKTLGKYSLEIIEKEKEIKGLSKSDIFAETNNIKKCINLKKNKSQNFPKLNNHSNQLYSSNSKKNEKLNFYKKLNEQRINNSLNINFSKTVKKQFSLCPRELNQLIKDKDITSRKIFDYYVYQNSKDTFKPIKNFDKFLKKKYRFPKKRFNKIYCINKSYLNRLDQLKNNRIIAFKDDFNIKEYQSTLLQLLKKRVDDNNLNILGKNYRDFNENMNKKIIPKGRFTNLADKIRNNAPFFLIKRLEEMDKEKLIARAKFLKSNIDFNKKKKNSNENIFKEFDLYMEKKYNV